jgi:hypothetical protein
MQLQPSSAEQVFVRVIGDEDKRSTYMSGQPDGRPTVSLGAKSKRCAENNNA